jgi:uncharacterized protein (TIGR00251 family)
MKNLKDSIKRYQDGAAIDLFVTPDASTSVFPAGYNEFRKRIEIKVSSPSKENKANLEVIKIVSGFFDKHVSDVFVVSGFKSKEKTIFIKGIPPGNAVKKIQEHL